MPADTVIKHNHKAI